MQPTSLRALEKAGTLALWALKFAISKGLRECQPSERFGTLALSLSLRLRLGRRRLRFLRRLRLAPDRILEVERVLGGLARARILVRRAVRANISFSVNHLRHGSEVLEQLIQADGLLVVGAEYSLETGVVDFFDLGPEVG